MASQPIRPVLESSPPWKPSLTWNLFSSLFPCYAILCTSLVWCSLLEIRI